MEIICDDKKTTWTFVPVEEGEESNIVAILEVLKPGSRFFYFGRYPIEGEEGLIELSFYANVSNIRKGVGDDISLPSGSKELRFRGSSLGDREKVWDIRNFCFYGISSLLFVGVTEVKGNTSLIFTGKRCANCGGGMLNYSAVFCPSCGRTHNFVPSSAPV